MTSRFRKCKSCFRFTEDRKDAKAKGLKPRDTLGCGDFHRKPRKGVKVYCMSVHKKEVPKANDCGCKFHQYRWTWNLGIWWRWHFKYRLDRLFCKYIRCPIGGLRKPVPLLWVDSYDGMRDIIVKNSEPQCPHCGEMPYSYERCKFCGQRFVQDEKTEEMSQPPEEEVVDCLMCGGKKTMKGYRTKINNHFHGKCEKCGAVMIS